MNPTVAPVNKGEENLFSCTHDGPQAYNYEPVRQDGEGRIKRNNGHRGAAESWCEENQWRTGQVSWCELAICGLMLCSQQHTKSWKLINNIVSVMYHIIPPGT